VIGGWAAEREVSAIRESTAAARDFGGM
jgi:hypothetical protein